MPSASSCKCSFSRSFVIRLLHFHEISKAIPKAFTISKIVVIGFFLFFPVMQYDGLPFCRGTSLKEPKVESYNQLCFALIFSYQLQPSHCPSYPTQTSQLSLSLLLSCSFPVPSLSLLLSQAAAALKQSKYIWTDQCVSGVVSSCRQSPFFSLELI